MRLETPIKQLHGVGEKLAEKLAILDIYTVEDLLYYYPRRYEDFSHPRTIDQLVTGDTQIIQGRIVSIENDVSPRQRMKLTKAIVADQTGQVAITWFNQPFLIRVLKEGTTWLFAGKVERDFRGNTTMLSPVIEREGKILPVYSETAGVTSKFLRKLTYELKPFIARLDEWLPNNIIRDYRLTRIADALTMIHFPESIDQISAAKRRLAFDELFLLLSQIQATKQDVSHSKAPACATDDSAMAAFISQLPFTLTESQQQASSEILRDLARSTPMNRLLEGDVGSGKTAVGAMAAFSTIKAGLQTVWMSPTEILANQHFATCQKFLAKQDIKILLLTGSTAKKNREHVNEYDLIIGTQAVIQEMVVFDRLGLIIVDEQHRFGVKQRAHLLGKDGLVPHFLAMTATPIPRTLALTVYGDLDISQLQSVPTGRKPIISRFVSPDQRKQAYDFIRKQIQEGRQAFVVCPLVEQGISSKVGQMSLGLEEKKAATVEYDKLSKLVFPDLRIGLLHGRMKPNEKEEMMRQFKDREVDVLVSTAVIEVGIDIPNATVMMIEDAERFGLAQLHQFRGRVGRGEHQSYCFVFTESQNPAAYERLGAFTRTSSGFDLAELDLELRGPGQLAGLQQSGFSGLKIARLSDIDLIQLVKKAVVSIFDEGIEKYPALQEKLSRSADTAKFV